MKNRNIKSFTLIEMLIVIVVIGILSSALIPRVMSVQARARDTKRKTDLRTIYNWLQLYFADNIKYPTPWVWCWYRVDYPLADCYVQSSATPSMWVVSLSWILNFPLPNDPINSSAGWVYQDNVYRYAYGNVFDAPKHMFDLWAQLENKSDPDRCELKRYRWYW